MKSRVISRHKAEQITLAITIKANEDNIKSIHADYMALSDALLPIHMEGIELLKSSDTRLLPRRIKKYETKVDERMTYREVAKKILPFSFYGQENNEVLDMFHTGEDYRWSSIPHPQFVYNKPDRSLTESHEDQHELFPVYCDAVNRSGAISTVFEARILAPLGCHEALYPTPELLTELVPMFNMAGDIYERAVAIHDANLNLAQDIKSNIARARTTKNICNDWPEIAPFVARLYGEEEASQQMETPLGNIIARHHPNLLGAPA